mgnify:CR=1 FL=1
MKIFKYIGVLLLLVFVAGIVLLYKGDIPADVVDAKYSNPASQFLTMDNGARVHYRDQGNPEGSPLVLIHGSNASLHTWEPWIERLGNDYRIVTMDLPGHGLTGSVPDADYSSEAQLNTVAAVVDHLNLTQFTLGGNSMGGGVTWRYTLENPDQVQAMILVDASGLPEWWAERRAQLSETEREAPIAFQLLGQAWFRTIARYLDPYYLAVQGVKSSYNNSDIIDQALIDRYYELSLRAGTRDATLARFGRQRNWEETFDLSELDQPTLIMWGKEDSLIPASTADQFAEALPNTSVVVYDGVGHIPMEEIPDRSAEDVRLFMKTLTSSQ